MHLRIVIPGTERSEGARNPCTLACDLGFRARRLAALRNDAEGTQHARPLTRLVLLILLLANVAGFSPAHAAQAPQCARGDIVLWGDGRHDDTAALNAWFRGENLVWAETGELVGATIADRTFLLSDAVYPTAGSGRTLERFRMIWPERGETVSGGVVQTGDDANRAPVAVGVSIVGGDSGEGVPFDAPDIAPADRSDPARCAAS